MNQFIRFYGHVEGYSPRDARHYIVRWSFVWDGPLVNLLRIYVGKMDQVIVYVKTKLLHL